ncbi:MAG: O-antigen ligase family protein [Planctomycetota bacterium]|jgi:O-antigen ligase/tetratricopeptide (TPR) repeat protein
MATLGAFLALFAVVFRLMFSAAASSFLYNGLADLAVFLALVFLLLATARVGARPLRVNLASGAIFLFALSFFIAARSSYYPRAGVSEVMNLAAGACLFLVVSNALFSRRSAPRAALVLVSAGVVVAAVAAYQYLWELPRILEEVRGRTPPFTLESPVGITIDEKNFADFVTRIESREIFSTFLTSNVLAGFLALAIPVTLGLMFGVLASRITRRRKIAFGLVLGGLAVLQLALLPLTKSKGGLAAAAAAVAAFVVVVLYRALPRKAFVALVCAAVMGGAVLVWVAAPRADRFLNEAKTSLGIRLGYWRATARVIRETPLEGTGPGNFDKFYVKHKAMDEREVKNPHNAPLYVCAQGGVFSLVFFLAFWVLVFAGKNGDANHFSPKAPKGAGVCAGSGREESLASPFFPSRQGAAIAALPAAALVYSALVYGEGGLTMQGDLLLCLVVLAGAVLGAFLIWLFWAATDEADEGFVRAGLYCGVAGFLASSMIDVTLSDAGATTAVLFAAAAVAPRGKSAALTRAPWQALAGAALVAVGVFVFMAKVFLPFWQSEMLVQSAGAYLRSATLASREGRPAGPFLTAAAGAAREALKVDPGNAEIPALLGNVYEAATSPGNPSSKNFALAKGFYSRAVDLDCLHRGALEGLARLYSRAGPKHLTKALEVNMKLVGLYPNSSRYHVMTARTLEKLGVHFEAVSHYRLALSIDERIEQHGIQLTEAEKAEIEEAIKRNEAALGNAARPRD